VLDHDIRGARFYFGKSGWLLERRSVRANEPPNALRVSDPDRTQARR